MIFSMIAKLKEVLERVATWQEVAQEELAQIAQEIEAERRGVYLIEPSDFDACILFVHGIGQQRPGDPLMNAGLPLLDWLQGQESCKLIRITQARHRAKDVPAYAVVEGEISGTPIRWLLAESCWADEFYVPEPGEFAAWLLRDGSVISVLHVAGIVLRHVRCVAK